MIAHDFPNFEATTYASQGNAILGIRDSGKTVTAEGLAERLMDGGIPITVIDPIGRWRFLRVPGKGKGYPVVVAGGAEGDLPLTPANAESLIRAAMQNRISIVFDLYEMNISKADWRRICEAVVRTMLYENKKYGLRHIFIEEAAEFAPQRVQPGQGAVYAEIEKLARMGGNALLGYTLINQRSEEVNKAVLELCDTLILHRQKGRNSLQNLEKWLKVASAKDGAKILESMPLLKQGEAWAWISGSDTPERIQFPLKNSFVPDRRATHGAIATVGQGVSSVAFVAAMKAALAEAEKVDEKPARGSKVVHPQENEPQPDLYTKAEVDSEYLRGRYQGYRQGVIDAVRSFKGDIDAIIQKWTDDPEAIDDIVDRVKEQTPYDPGPTPAPGRLTPIPQGWVTGSEPSRTAIPRRTNGAAPAKAGAEIRVLKVLAARHPARFTRAQWATLAGMKKTGGTWQTYVSRLRQSGYLDERGDGTVGLTSAGVRAAGHVDRPAAGSVLEGWKNALGTGPAKMIDALVRIHPNPMDRANLADRCGMTATGGTFQTYLSKLKTNGLVEIHGRKIKASPTLFMDGAR